MAPALPARFTGFRRREAEGWADHSVRWFWANNHEPIEEARRSHLVQIWQTIGKFLFRLRDLLQSPISWNFFFLFLSFSDHEIDSLLHHIAREPCNHYVALTQRGVNQPWLITAVTTFMVLFQSPALRRLADGRSASD